MKTHLLTVMVSLGLFAASGAAQAAPIVLRDSSSHAAPLASPPAAPTASVNAAGTPLGAAASGVPGVPFLGTPGVRDARLQILRQERGETQRRLAEAVQALPKAADATAAEAAVARLRGDMSALDREIAAVESQRSIAPGQSGRVASTSALGAKKPAASAVGSVVQDSAQATATAPAVARASFEPWDVFRNFGQTGNNP